jgi:citrate lyase subunit beta/citryl-CoA lyase
MASKPETFSARPWLFAPGDSERKMGKAAAGPADVVVFDLEDAVTQDGKPRARSAISAFLTARPEEDRRQLWVRVNPLDGHPGVGAVSYHGAMLDRPHLARAQVLLASGGRG